MIESFDINYHENEKNEKKNQIKTKYINNLSFNLHFVFGGPTPSIRH